MDEHTHNLGHVPVESVDHQLRPSRPADVLMDDNNVAFLSNPVVKSQNISGLGGLLRAASRREHYAVLSRQTSFDDGGETKLSSSQVKERLKTHVLNRRRRSAAIDRHSHADDIHQGVERQKTVDGTFAMNDFQNPRNVEHRVARWHSADSTDLPNWEPVKRAEPPDLRRKSEVQPKDIQSNLHEHSPELSCSPLSHPVQLSDRVLLEMIEQLSSRVVPKDGCPLSSAESSTVNVGGDMRKTISAPNLFEPPWPLRIVSQLFFNQPSLLSAPQSSAAVTPHLASLLSHRVNVDTVQKDELRTLATTVDSSAPCTLNSEDMGSSVKMLPLTDSAHVDNVLQLHSALRLTTRPPLKSSASEDSAVDRTALELKMRSYLTELMLGDRLRTFGALLTKRHQSQGTPASSPANLSGETAMDWETNELQDSERNCTIRENHLSESSIRRAETTMPDISMAWSDLPVEDWLSASPNDQTSMLANDSQDLLTGLAFDPVMLDHSCLCPTSMDFGTHPECSARISGVLDYLSRAPFRVPPTLPSDLMHLLRSLKATVARKNPTLQQILTKLTELGMDAIRVFLLKIPLVGFCRLFRARMATEEELCLFHSRDYVLTFGVVNQPTSPQSPSSQRLPADLQGCPRLCKLNCGGLGVDSDTVWNPKSTARAARLAVGQVVCLAHKVANHHIRNGFALIRPPGHHAEPDHAMGFCYFNSVAVAALHLIRNCSLSRVLILDWDIHHGNGTKFVTMHHPGLLYISIHRYDKGTFFPGTGPIVDLPCSSKHSWSSDTTSTGDSKSNFSHISRSQLINIAWETPQIQENNSLPASFDAGARRELWRKHYTRRKPARFELKGSGVLRPSGDSSSSSVHSITSTRENELPSCYCLRSSGSGSSQFCSICLSHSLCSSTTSSPQSSSPFVDSSVVTTLTTQQGLVSDSFVPVKRSLLGFGDAEYLAAFRCVILPIAYEFQPEVILISAGFDAAPGHGEALGGYTVSPGAFAWITRQCLSIADGRVVLALEGGYNPSVVGDCVAACLNSLLLPTPRKQWVPFSSTVLADPDSCMDAYQSACDWISSEELNRPPRSEAVTTLMHAVHHQTQNGWRCMQYVHEDNVSMSFTEAIDFERRMAVQISSRPAAEPYMSACNSPLTTGFAQLRMDQS